MYFNKQIYGIHDGHAYYIIVDENKKEKMRRVWASVEATTKLTNNLLDDGYEFLLYYDKQPIFVKKDNPVKVKEEIKKMYEEIKR